MGVGDNKTETVECGKRREESKMTPSFQNWVIRCVVILRQEHWRKNPGL